MDDRRFDALARSLAGASSRRSILRGLLGIGGALTGWSALEAETDAARRPTPTPTPMRCPGQQTWDGFLCVCPGDAPHQCGPACCTGTHDDPYLRPPEHSECCDNACCLGTCYGEELCCPTNEQGTDLFPLPPSHKVCDGPDGQVCCESVQQCCFVDGCCDTVCYGGMVGNDFCCDVDRFCPGIDQESGLCCAGGETCCGAGTAENVCVDLSLEGSCCTIDDCSLDPGGCPVVCAANQCLPAPCDAGEVCCNGACCPADRCNVAAGVCCDDGQSVCGSDVDACCAAPLVCCAGSATCCSDAQCNDSGFCCSGDDIACLGDCCPAERCGAGGCCEPGMIACGAGCCDSATQYCTESQTCACTSGQCCNGDTSTCSQLGFDPQCVACVEGTCSDAGLQFQDCGTDGWCNAGSCIGCHGPGVECTDYRQCCNRQGYGCFQGICQRP